MSALSSTALRGDSEVHQRDGGDVSVSSLAERVRMEFPYFSDGGSVAYLDSASSTQKARVGLEAMDDLYRHHYANVHRGAYRLSGESTALFEGARGSVAHFLDAGSEREVIFTRGTTEAINLVAGSFGLGLRPGDEIVVSELEHHSNLVPWQLLAERCGLQLRFWRMDSRGCLCLSDLESLLSERTRLLAVTHVSNVFGTIIPVGEAIALAHSAGALVLLDGAQAVPHLSVSVRDLDADFYAFSGHKLYAPSGIGVLWGRYSVLESMPPWQGGGEMITEVRLEGSSYCMPPSRFEAGTPAIAEAVALGAVCRWLLELPREALWAHTHSIYARAHETLGSIEGVEVYGAGVEESVPTFSFNLADVHPHDLATYLDSRGVAVRTGHHCAQPALAALGLEATARASFGLYNCEADVDRLAEGVASAAAFFRR
ncbi:MAG: cysteine desulfurase [Alphaproteobacteria bacterium]